MPRRKGEFSYRGYTLEQLQSMDLEALAEVLPSRVRRKLGRGLSPEERKFVEKVQGHGATGPASPSPGASRGDAPLLKTHLRRMVVLPAMVGKEIQVHNGKTFDKIAIVPEMIGHYLGELALTRKRVKHGAAGIGATRSSKFIPLK
ncbi:MAG: 30S ribosomal protein S19 [Halobacteria archaeon]